MNPGTGTAHADHGVARAVPVVEPDAMTDTGVREAYAALARGRRLRRAGTAILGVCGVWFVVGVLGCLGAVAIGWLADDDAGPLPFVMAVPAVGFVAAVVLVQLGQRIVRNQLWSVAASPGDDVPDHLQIGTARPIRQIRVLVALLVVGLVALVVIQPWPWTWVPSAIIGILTLVAFAWIGPSALNISSAYLDESGIRLPLLGVHAPWTSIAAVDVHGASHLRITIGGPLTPTGDLPQRWTQRALAANPPGTVLTMPTDRPELAVWVAGRYLVSS